MLTLLQGEQGEGLTGPRIWCQATRGRWHVSSLELYLHLGTAWSRFRPQADGCRLGTVEAVPAGRVLCCSEGGGSKAVGTTGCGVRTPAPCAVPTQRRTDQLVDMR